MVSDPIATPPPISTPPSSPPGEGGHADERRLHPFSWIFVGLTQMRSFALPLIAVVAFGRGAGWELWGILGAVFVALYSLIYSFGFRYRLTGDELVVREGILFRTERHVPYARIQNVVQQRNVLHRAFGVTELHLESAGGGKPEAVMSVITLPEAARIEAILARGGAVSAIDADDAATPLLALDAGEILRLGIMGNRGAVIVGALFALFYQFEPWERVSMRPIFSDASRLYRRAHEMFPDAIPFAAVLVIAAIAFAVVLKLLSIVMAVVQFHRFRLHGDDTRVGTESGLFTRRTASARLDKIQRWTVSETWVARRLGRRALECDVATGTAEAGEQKRERLRWLAPIATPATIDALLARFAPALARSRVAWRPLHPRARGRIFRQLTLGWLVAAIPVTIVFGPAAAIAMLAIVGTYAWFDARGHARFGAWAFDGDVFAFRRGWLRRRWTFARVEKGQSVAFTQSPFDRRAGMASVQLDTAGAATGTAMKVSYLAVEDARVLADALQRALAQASSPEVAGDVPIAVDARVAPV